PYFHPYACNYHASLTTIRLSLPNALPIFAITITTNPAPPVIAAFSASPTSGVAPLTVSFTNLSSGATGYNWDFGDGDSSTNQNPSNIYTNAGSYNVSLTAVGLGGTNTLTQ